MVDEDRITWMDMLANMPVPFDNDNEDDNDVCDVEYSVIRNLSCALLIFSRNQLLFLPSTLCQLSLLEVLLVASNRLVSLPEEIGLLQRLTELVD